MWILSSKYPKLNITVIFYKFHLQRRLTHKKPRYRTMDKTIGYCSETTGYIRTSAFLYVRLHCIQLDDFSTHRSHKGH